jgi:hypothetical protein
MPAVPEQDTIAEQVLTIACSAVGEHWSRDFPICVERGLWGSKSSTAARMSHLDAFDSVQPGQLGIAVHGFRWNDPSRPPRNAKGSAYGPRTPFAHFLHAQFSEFVLFEVDGPRYTATSRVWSVREPDEWDLRIPINVFAHERDVELRMDEINPAVAEAIRMSGIYASMPWVIAPATLGMPPGGAKALPRRATGPTDVLGHAIHRREASAVREALLAGRTAAPCAFCERECLACDLEAAHLKQRRACSEHERLDPAVAVLACVACHHAFDQGMVLIDADGIIRTTPAAEESQWRRDWVASLDSRPFSSFTPANGVYLAWHREELQRRLETRQEQCA